MTKNYVCRIPYLRNHTSYDHHLWYTCENDNIFRQFLSFSQNSNFSGCHGSKGQKITQNKMSLMPYISGTIHYMIFIFGTHMYNDGISRWLFHFFKILIFWVIREVEGQKMARNVKKFCTSHSVSQELYII